MYAFQIIRFLYILDDVDEVSVQSVVATEHHTQHAGLSNLHICYIVTLWICREFAVIVGLLLLPPLFMLLAYALIILAYGLAAYLKVVYITFAVLYAMASVLRLKLTLPFRGHGCRYFLRSCIINNMIFN